MRKLTKKLLLFQYLWIATLVLLVITPALYFGTLSQALPFIITLTILTIFKGRQIVKREKDLNRQYDERSKLIHFEAGIYTMYGLFIIIFAFYGYELATLGTISFRTNIELLGGVIIWLISGFYLRRKY